jgi:hypothetical protein
VSVPPLFIMLPPIEMPSRGYYFVYLVIPTEAGYRGLLMNELQCTPRMLLRSGEELTLRRIEKER